MSRILAVLGAVLWMSLPLAAQDVADVAPLPGWEVHASAQDFATLQDNVIAAIEDSPLAVVTRAGPTQAAAGRGIEIPGNTVIGAFNNAFAVRILRLSSNAMIHAPVRFYVTENADGSATLSYIRPSTIFAPYAEAAGPDLAAAAAELDALFAAIAQDALAR